MITLAKYKKVIIDSNKKKIIDGRVRLFRKIAHHKNKLPFSQLKNKSECRRVYKLLSSSDINLPGKTIMYLENIEKYNYLKNRLRNIYGRKLSVKNWRQVTVVSFAESTNSRLLLLVDKRSKSPLKDYLIRIKLEFGSTKNAKIYVKVKESDYEVSVFSDTKNGRTRIRSLSYKTYLPMRTYIYSKQNESGNKKKITMLRKIRKFIFNIDPNLSSSKKYELLMVHDDIRKLNRRYKYANISMNLRGLLFYAVHEDDMLQFNKSIECLANSGKLEDKIEEIYRYNPKSKDTCQVESLNYSAMEDFPFLLPEYNDFKHILPIDWTFKVLKRIRNNLEGELELLSIEELKYKVTKEFFECIKEYERSLDEIGDQQFDNQSFEIGRSRKSLLKYYKQIRRYLNVKETAHAINRKTLYEVKEEQLRQQDLLQTILKLAEASKLDIIPIDLIIKKSKLKSGVQDILESIERNAGQKYMITQTCIISRSKADALRSLLSNLPICENAHKILLDNGIPRRCLSYNGSLDNIVEKLGFYTRRVLISSDYLHYIDVVFQKVPKELKSPPPYWFLNTRFGRLQPFSNDRHNKYCTITYPIKLYNKQENTSDPLKAIQDSSKIAELRYLAEQLVRYN